MGLVVVDSENSKIRLSTTDKTGNYKRNVPSNRPMTSKSWAVTLTPLLIAILHIVEIKVTGRTPTDADIKILFAEFAAFISSGAIGALVATRKK